MKVKIVFALGLALLLQSCIPSLHPLYTKDTLVFNSNIVGVWKDDGTDWVFEKGEDQSYNLRVKHDDGDETFYRAHLVMLDQYMFMDFIQVKKNGKDIELSTIAPLLPTHSFAKLKIEDNRIAFFMLDEDWLRKLFDERKIRIKHEKTEEGHIVLTAPTEDLQKFVVKYAEDEEAFGAAFDLERGI